jgi:hypothetical protein
MRAQATSIEVQGDELMSKQAANEEAKHDLPRLLEDILADLESALNSARNKPAKKLLQERIGRLRSAIDVIAASEQPARSTADTEEPGRLFGT